MKNMRIPACVSRRITTIPKAKSRPLWMHYRCFHHRDKHLSENGAPEPFIDPNLFIQYRTIREMGRDMKLADGSPNQTSFIMDLDLAHCALRADFPSSSRQ